MKSDWSLRHTHTLPAVTQRSISPYDIEPFVADNEVTEIAPGTYYCTGFSGVTAFETDDGLVLVDTGLPGESTEMAEQLRRRTEKPIHTVVYTHGHVDHAFGLSAFLTAEQDPPQVIGHEAMPARFERYRRTAGHNEAINSRQFGGTPSMEASAASESQFGSPEYPPTTLYRDDLTVRVGDLTFEIHHGRGETDDHSWIYCPERDVLCTGDFYISVAPNAGNPQKVQRYPWDWAATLERMAGVGAETLSPGHGTPLIDAGEEINDRLRTTATYLDTIVERTLDELNQGSPPHVDVVHAIDLPDPEEPWLADVYDSSEFIVRSVLRYYGGWWSGRPSDLKPARREALAAELSDLVGGPTLLLDRAEELLDAGESRLACHLADRALEAAPSVDGVQRRVAAVYEQQAEDATDLMSQNIYASAAEYAAEGRRFR